MAITAPRIVIIVSAFALSIGNLGALGATATAACTFGTAPGTTCGEALVLMGYP